MAKYLSERPLCAAISVIQSLCKRSRKPPSFKRTCYATPWLHALLKALLVLLQSQIVLLVVKIGLREIGEFIAA